PPSRMTPSLRRLFGGRVRRRFQEPHPLQFHLLDRFQGNEAVLGFFSAHPGGEVQGEAVRPLRVDQLWLAGPGCRAAAAWDASRGWATGDEKVASRRRVTRGLPARILLYRVRWRQVFNLPIRSKSPTCSHIFFLSLLLAAPPHHRPQGGV